MKTAILLGLVCAMLQAQGAPPQVTRKQATVSHRVEPEYTGAARAAQLQGTATVYVEIAASGAPQQIHVVQGLGLGLDEKAEDAVKQWTFAPATENGEPVLSAEAVEVRFAQPGAVWRMPRAAYTVDRRGRFKPSQVVVRPVLSRYVQPSPQACEGASGTAAIEFSIDSTGTPAGVHAFDPLHESGMVNVAIGSAAIEAVQSWRFQPATLDGKPVAEKASVELECGNPEPPIPASAYLAGRGLTRPQLAQKVEPEYSEPARRAKLQGVVVLYIVVDAGGHPTNVAVMKRLGMGLDEKAIEAVLRWRFVPGLKNGRPVAVAATVEVNFRLL
jgi:TonB family protein